MAKCKNCGRERLDHRAKDLACPLGRKSRVGYITYHDDKFFREKIKVSSRLRNTPRKNCSDKVHWTDGERIAVCSPYGNNRWENSTNIEKVTCCSCLRVIKSRFFD